jgi:SAM-dependent methyltransferase
MSQLSVNEVNCWVCDSPSLYKIKNSDLSGEPKSTNFTITDKNYGETFALYRCNICGFVQCSEMDDPTIFYEDMVDELYQDTRGPRLVQAHQILKLIPSKYAEGNLLDVGAGSGILVEAAIKAGFNAKGIEPSSWLHSKAVGMGIPVVHGTLPSEEIGDNYDVITLIDVLEHVANPVNLLNEIRKVLSNSGCIIIVIPDLKSVAAKITKGKWWHFRYAHLGYFDSNTIKIACERACLKIVGLSRPTWYLPLDYLWDRLFVYLPKALYFSPPAFLKKVTLPINLFDSIAVIVKKNNENN